MKDKAIVNNEIITELRELRWRINKLEAMKNGRDAMIHSHSAEENYVKQSQSSQFFLTLHSAPVFHGEDDFEHEEGISMKDDIRLKKVSE